MTILVFSDSHGSTSGMYWAIEEHKPDQILFLGDGKDDIEEVEMVYPRLPFCIVAGNCDGWCMEPARKLIKIGGKTVLMGHGHYMWEVKRGYQSAIADAHVSKADILLFGHTHVPVCQHFEDGLWMMNPGPASLTYGLITIENGVVDCSLHKYPDAL